VVPALSGLHIGFTQRSLWDIEADSSPFFDTSYMPELIYESEANLDLGSRGGFKWMGYQIGVKHESNGRDGPNSRSLNTAYARAGLAFGRFDGWNVIVVPRLHAYVGDLSDNPDMADYRGYGDLQVVVGRNDYFALSFAGRLGAERGRGAMQWDLTVPLRIDRMFNFATYLMVQYWNGYGESLRTYDVKNESVRAGFSLVR
jgi:phospholipase A1/A2